MQVDRQSAAPRPWWRHGLVWMVVGGPAVVIVAGIVTAVIAFRGADPVVGSGAEDGPATTSRRSLDLQPAMVGRNHAATGQAPAPR